MKIVRTDSELQTPFLDQELRSAGHELVLLPDGTSESDLINATRDADLILMCYTPITRNVIKNARSLKGIVKYGVGIDAIDIPAAIEAGVAVVNVPEYAEDTVAEGAFALMIALAKKLPALNTHMSSTGWAWPEPSWLGSDIAGKTVGIIGLGKIGRSMARMAGLGFRANIVAYSPHTSKEEMEALGITKVENLRDLMAQSDFVSIHCVLNDETRGMVGKEELSAMKETAYLINVSRGAIVDEEDLVEALLNKKIAGAGLDVFSQEPLTRTGHTISPLFDLPNVILSPHLTFYTQEAMQRLEEDTLARCFEVLDGRDVLIKSTDPRLLAQTKRVTFANPSNGSR